MKLVKSKYDTEYACDLEIENTDLKHTMVMLKDEINELVKTYLEPFLKGGER